MPGADGDPGSGQGRLVDEVLMKAGFTRQGCAETTTDVGHGVADHEVSALPVELVDLGPGDSPAAFWRWNRLNNQVRDGSVPLTSRPGP